MVAGMGETVAAIKAFAGMLVWLGALAGDFPVEQPSNQFGNCFANNIFESPIVVCFTSSTGMAGNRFEAPGTIYLNGYVVAPSGIGP